MVRLRSLSILGLSIGVVAAGLGGLYALLQHEPRFYQEAAPPPGPERTSESRNFEQKAFALYDQVTNEQEWREEFTEQQVNSWLAEDFTRRSELAELLADDFHDPRVVFQPGKVLLAFRYGEALGTIVSVEARIWLSAAEPNTVAVEIVRLRAGALPLSLKTIQDLLTDNARDLNLDIQWYRNDGNPVALIRLQADKRDPTFQIQALEFRQGSLYVKGRSLDPDVAANVKISLNKTP